MLPGSCPPAAVLRVLTCAPLRWWPAQLLSDEEAEALKAQGLVVEEAAPPTRVDPAAEWDALLEEEEQDISAEDLAAIGYSSVDEALAGLRTVALRSGLDADLLASAAQLDGLLDEEDDEDAAAAGGQAQERRRRAPREEPEVEREKAVVCTRCHALRHTG